MFFFLNLQMTLKDILRSFRVQVAIVESLYPMQTKQRECLSKMS